MKKTNKLISILLVLAMLLSMAPIAVFTVGAASPAYNGTPIKPLKINESNYNMLGLTEENWSDYSGYYAIRNASELYGFAALVNGGNRSVNGVLLQDIVVNTSVSASGAVYSWTPIGATRETAFLGTFDGAGHSISGIYYKNADATHVGLFGNIGEYAEYTNAAVKNLILKNSYIYGKQYVGGIAGCLWGENVKVVNCKTDSDVSVVSAHVYGDNLSFYAGGIVGSSYGTTMGYTTYVTNCVSFASVTGTLLEMPENYGLQYEDNYIAAITGSWQDGSNAGERVTVRDCYYLKNSVKVTAGDRMIYANWGRGGGYQWTDGAGWLPWQDNVYCTILDSASAAHTCVAVATPEIKANCTYGGHSAYSHCLICGGVTSGTKTVTEANDTHFYKGATCTENGVCQLCGDANGPKNPDNHISWIPANCMAPATCESCSATKGEKNPDNHTDADKFTYTVNETDESKHDAFYEQCKAFSHTEGHSYDAQGKCTKCTYECAHPAYTDGVCDTCAYKCAHSDIENNKCTVCGLEGSVKYINRVWNSTAKQVEETVEIAPVSVTEVTAETAELTDGWYIVNGTVNNKKYMFKVSGTVHLILADGASLTTEGCIVNEGNSLYIYAQSTGADMGLWKLKDVYNHNAVLGGTEKTAAGKIVINGGFIQASVSDRSRYGAAIGSGYNGTGGEIIINGGFVKASSYDGAAIGCGVDGTPGIISINGGTVYASAEDGVGIGSGWSGEAGNVTINGGNIYGYSSSGKIVGAGYRGDPVTVTDGSGNDVTLRTITLSGAAADTPVTKVEGITYGLTDVKTYNTNKLYFWLPADAVITSITAGGNEYICNGNLTYYTSHDWSNLDGICANGCGTECPHENETGDTCSVCGSHICRWSYSASGDTITAVCENTGGNCPDSEGTLTILAPADLYVDGTTAKEAVIDNQLVENVDYTVTYSAPYGLPPKDAGTYTASVTVGGATASVEFTLLNYAAKVTDKDGNAVGTYKTFEDAITAADGSEGSTVTLLDDITLTTRQDISSGKFTLDLNGNNLVNETDRVFYISEKVDLTIKDSGENGTVETKYEYVDCIVNYGKLTVESGIIKGDSGIRNYGVLYFNDGTVEADFFAAITNYSSGSVYVYDGVLKGSKNSGAVDNNGTLYIYGGEIKGIANSNTAYISGGTIDRDDYAALNLLGGTVEVTGGSFTGTDYEYGDYSGTPYGEWTVCYTEGATLTLKGGEFPGGFVAYNATANAFLAEDYYYKDADGKLIDVADDATIINGYVKVSKGADLADAVITLDETQFTYSGMEHKPTVIVTVGGKTLTEGKDYTLTFANNVNAGTATVTIKAIGQAAGGIAGGGESIGNSSNLGDITESVYTGEVTKEFTINKKPVTVTATAPDKVYDGTTDVLEYSKVIVEFDGAVEGEMLGFTVGKAWYDTADAGTDKIVHIIYAPVASNNIDNYEFPMNPEYSTDNCYVAAKADISKKAVTATATASDKQYNGVNDIDKSKITVILDGIVGGESVETTVETAWIEGKSVGDNYLVPVFFSVSGDAAKNYIFPINELYPTEFYYAEATVNIYNDFTPKKETEYTVNSNDWINNDFVVTANKGYQLSLSNEVNGWSDTLSKSEETENGSITFYVKNKETGAISLAVTENYKIDKTKPHGYFSDSHGRGYEYLLLDEIQTEPYYENEDIFTHKYEAWDDASGIANMEYYFSITKLSKAELDSVSGWTEFELDIDIEDIFEFPGDETYSYIRVMDKAGNTIYYVAHLVYDGEMAKINGVLDGFTYYTTQIISVTDNFKLDYVTVNGEVIKSGYDTITLEGNCNATYEIFAYDLAGNPRDEAIITMKPIATLSEPVDNLKEETLKSSDKETIEAVKAKVEKIDTTDATEEEKAELQKILDKCDALLKIIADTQAEIDELGKNVDSYTEDSVKSSDSEDLTQLKEDIQNLIDNDNTTENEKTALEDMIKDIEGLEDKIAETEEKLEEIKNTENNFNPETVSSDDKAAIENAIAEIEAVNPDNLTDEQREEYEEIKAGFEALLEEIAAAEKAVADIGAQLEMFGEERVTKFWEDDIEALKAKIDELLADENMGKTEKAKLNEYKAQAEKLIEIINTPVEYFSLRFFYLIWDCLTWKYNGILGFFSQIFAK